MNYPSHDLAGKVDFNVLQADLARDFNRNPAISVQTMCDLFQAAGIDVYVMGGAVRDWVLGVSARDIDLTVSGSVNDALSAVEPLIRHLRVEPKPLFGLAYLLGDAGDVDLNSMRDCNDIAGSEDIDKVHFRPVGTLETDAACRDFTFNAMYYHVKTGELISFHDTALSDLQSKTLRLVMDERKLAIDYRTTIRILQFMARGYNPTDYTRAVLHEKLDHDILSYPKYKEWMLFHVPKGSVDFTRYVDLALANIRRPEARDLFVSWLE